MSNGRLGPVALAVLVIALAGPRLGAGPQGPPARLTDLQFWELTRALSEPSGFFPSDNLVSNELVFPQLVPPLRERPAGGAYLGVGPEQNFTYIAAARPDLAVIIDIRRGNLQLHLLYKALFERSPNRRAFVAALFGREPLANVDDGASAADLMFAARLAPMRPLERFARDADDLVGYLVQTRGFELAPGDPEGIRFVWRAFREAGPDLSWSMNGGRQVSRNVTLGSLRSFARLASQVDGQGRELSFLADEAAFQSVRDLQLRNLVVPVVGDFAGPEALVRVGDLLRQFGLSVSAFYVSNVEAYLRQGGLWDTFCRNVQALPTTESSLLLRPSPLPWAAPGVPPAVSPQTTIRIIRTEPITASDQGPRPWRTIPVGPRPAPGWNGPVPLLPAFEVCGGGPGLH